jgi:hypothetical protein
MAKGLIDENTYAKTLRDDARLKKGQPTEDAEAASQVQPEPEPFYPETLPTTPEGQMGLQFKEPFPVPDTSN